MYKIMEKGRIKKQKDECNCKKIEYRNKYYKQN